MNHTPTVSVLMPVYNSVAYLEAAIRSIIAQHYRDWELIVIDDGSSDGSGDLARRLAADDARIRVVVRDNRGVIATRNELLAEARGRFVAWMDSDDISAPDRLAKQVAFLEASDDHVCVGCQARHIDPVGRRLGVERYPADDAAIRAEQRTGGGFRFPTTVMWLSAARQAGPFREPFRIGEDLDFLLRLAEHGKFANLDEELYLYRQHADSAVAMLGEYWLAYRDAILDLAAERAKRGSDLLQRGEMLELPVAKRSVTPARRAEVYRHWALCVLHEGRILDGVRYLGSALRAAPSDLANWRGVARALLRRR